MSVAEKKKSNGQKSGMPGCFLDKIGHRCFHVREGLVKSGLTTDVSFFFALRRAYGSPDISILFFCYTCDWRVNESAQKGVLYQQYARFCLQNTGYAWLYLLSFGSARLCPPCTLVFVHFCARFCPHGAAAKSLPRTFQDVKTRIGYTRFCPRNTWAYPILYIAPKKCFSITHFRVVKIWKDHDDASTWAMIV